MDFESNQFLEEGEPVVELDKSELVFTGPEGDTTLGIEDVIMFLDENPVLEVSRDGIDLSNPDSAVPMINENYDQCGIAILQLELEMGRSSFILINSPTVTEDEDEDEMVNKIAKITNIDSIEFNRNKNNKFNRLYTSAEVNSTICTYSDEHVISSSALKTLLDKFCVEITGQITETSCRFDEVEQWTKHQSSPEPRIVGPESDVICSAQSIPREVHNTPQFTTNCRGIRTNLYRNPQWAYYLEHFPGDNAQWNFYTWNLLTGDKVLKYSGITISVGTNIYSFPNWWTHENLDPSVGLYQH
jgi:hypothetical protein